MTDILKYWPEYTKNLETRNAKGNCEELDDYHKNLALMKARPWYKKIFGLSNQLDAKYMTKIYIPKEPTVEGFFDYLTLTGKI